MTAGAVEVFPADAARWDDLAELFASSPTTSGCWCMWPRRPPGAHRDDPANRDELQALVRSASPPGLVAYREGRAVGWCAVGPRSAFPQYADESAPGAWAIACIFVAADARGAGVARLLVEAAVGYAARCGATTVDGPPPWWLPDGTDAKAAAAEQLRACGFKEIAPGARMPVLRIATSNEEAGE